MLSDSPHCPESRNCAISARMDHGQSMVKRKAPQLRAEARRRNLEQLAHLGSEIRASRCRRRWTQARLAAEAGIARPTVSSIERGFGGGHTLDAWQRISLALGTPLVVRLERDRLEPPADAGHLAIQQLVLRMLRASGSRPSVELPTRPAEPRRSADVACFDGRQRAVLLVECWNTFGDVGSAMRSTARKVVEADAMAAARWGERSRGVRAVWVVRASRRNRALVASYPDIFAARFPGSSLVWAETLRNGREPPDQTGLVWCDVAATRIFAWRRR